MKNDLCIVFRSRTDGSAIEKKLKGADIPYEMMPTPREFSAGCSISIRISEDHLEEVRAILAYSSNIKLGGIHPLKPIKSKKFLGLF